MRPNDDYEAIGQMAIIFGSEPIEQLARKNDSILLASWDCHGLDMVKFVYAIRNGAYFTIYFMFDVVSCLRCSFLFRLKKRTYATFFKHHSLIDERVGQKWVNNHE